MAYDEYLADRIHQVLKEKNANYYAKKMMGGLCFTVNDKMLCGIHLDKKRNDHLLMARIGEEAAQLAHSEEFVLPMDFTGRPMKGYVFITSEGFDLDRQLEKWIQLCLDFNPLAKSSKKRANI